MLDLSSWWSLGNVGSITRCKEWTGRWESSWAPPYRPGLWFLPHLGPSPQVTKGTRAKVYTPLQHARGHGECPACFPLGQVHFAFCRGWIWLIFPSEGYMMSYSRPQIQLSHKCWIARCAHIEHSEVLWNSKSTKATWQQGPDRIRSEGDPTTSLNPASPSSQLLLSFFPPFHPSLSLRPCISSLVKSEFKYVSTICSPRWGCYHFLAAGIRISPTIRSQRCCIPHPAFLSVTFRFISCKLWPFLENIN